MAVVTVTEVPMSRGGELTQTNRTYSRDFIVECDAIETSISPILNATGIPKPGNLYPDENRVYCETVSARPYEDPFTWLVSAKYAIPQGGGASTPSEDPCDEDPQISFGFVQYQRVMDRAYAAGDTQGTPTKTIINTAGQPFDPPVVQDESRPSIVITRNERTYSHDTMAKYVNTCNDDAITIAGVSLGVNEARMKNIDAVKKWDALGNSYYSVKYEIEINTESFIRKIVSTGFYELSGGQLKSIKDSDGSMVSEPTRLKQDGSAYPAGSPQTDFYAMDYQTYFKKSWTGLDLPTSA